MMSNNTEANLCELSKDERNEILFKKAQHDPSAIKEMVDPSEELIERMIEKDWEWFFPETWKTEPVFNHNDFLFNLAHIDPSVIEGMYEPSEELVERMIDMRWLSHINHNWITEDMYLKIIKNNPYDIVLLNKPPMRFVLSAIRTIKKEKMLILKEVIESVRTNDELKRYKEFLFRAVNQITRNPRYQKMFERMINARFQKCGI